jgi:hypothetical protein
MTAILLRAEKSYGAPISEAATAHAPSSWQDTKK